MAVLADSGSLGRSLPWVLMVLVLIGGFGLWVMGATSAPRACSPSAPRPWATETFAARISTLPPAPWPSAGLRAAPAKVPPTQERVTITMPTTPAGAPEAWERYERVPVGLGAVGTLPSGAGDWTAELTAWHPPGSPWLDPVRGEPMEFVADHFMPSTYPDGELEFVIEVKQSGAGGAGMNGRVRVNGGTVFDRRTGFDFTGSSAYATTDGQIRFSTQTSLAHRADLLLEVMLSYGEPSVAHVDAVSGQTVRIGASTLLRVEHVGSGHRSGVSHSGDGRRSMDLRDVIPGAPASLAVISAWPFPMADRLLLQTHAGGRWTPPIAANGLTALEWYDAPPPKTLRVHLLPHTARVQFELPPPTTLPVVNDLFDLPAPLATDPWIFQGALSDRLQVRIEGDLVPATGPPAAATAGEALFRILEGRSERYDPPTFTVKSDTFGPLSRIADWVRGVAL